MTTINAVFTGKQDDLETALVFSIHYTSTRRILGDRLYVSWICETEDYEDIELGENVTNNACIRDIFLFDLEVHLTDILSGFDIIVTYIGHKTKIP